jgi:hypothetical protein
MSQYEVDELAKGLFGAYEDAAKQYKMAIVDKMKAPLEFYKNASIFHPKRINGVKSARSNNQMPGGRC